MTQIIDPTDERVPIQRRLAPRPAVVHGTVALLDISKPRGDVFLAQLAARLAERAPDIKVKTYRKPTYTKPAPEALRRQIAAEADFVVEALAD